LHAKTWPCNIKTAADSTASQHKASATQQVKVVGSGQGTPYPQLHSMCSTQSAIHLATLPSLATTLATGWHSHLIHTLDTEAHIKNWNAPS
jgi:hypothetical protein